MLARTTAEEDTNAKLLFRHDLTSLEAKAGLRRVLHDTLNLVDQRLLLRQVADDDDTRRFKVAYAVAVAVAEKDGLLQLHDEPTRLFLEVAADGCVVIADKVVGGGALRTGKLIVQPAMEGADREFADGVVAGADGGDNEGHCVQV